MSLLKRCKPLTDAEIEYGRELCLSQDYDALKVFMDYRTFRTLLRAPSEPNTTEWVVCAGMYVDQLLGVAACVILPLLFWVVL